MDDSLAVWKDHQRNLVVPERYHFFPNSATSFGVDTGKAWLLRTHPSANDHGTKDIITPVQDAGQPPKEESVGNVVYEDEDEEDGQLGKILRVLKKVHHAFFSNEAGVRNVLDKEACDSLRQDESGLISFVDTRHLLALERKKILHGVEVVFSGIWPMDYSNPKDHPMYRLAVSLGRVFHVFCKKLIINISTVSNWVGRRASLSHLWCTVVRVQAVLSIRRLRPL
mgnify:FL=1